MHTGDLKTSVLKLMAIPKQIAVLIFPAPLKGNQPTVVS